MNLSPIAATSLLAATLVFFAWLLVRYAAKKNALMRLETARQEKFGCHDENHLFFGNSVVVGQKKVTIRKICRRCGHSRRP